jgi:hypothetical protein
MKLKPFHIFAPIMRVNEDERTVEAYAFVNEVVDGEGGVRLKRTSMEAATPDYMQWANVRRMHQADAVGVAKNVEWDDTGAKMTLEVVDEDAWQKCKRGVYKGLSVGVSATVMRGKDVEKCKWFETSLVDRPKDPGAVFIAVRAEGVDGDGEFEVEQLEPDGDTDLPDNEQRVEGDPAPELDADGNPITRADSDSKPSKPEKLTIYDCGSRYCRHTTEGGAQECMESQQAGLAQEIDWLEKALKDLKARKRAEDGGEEDPTIERLEDADPETVLARAQDLVTENSALLSRAETAEADLARVQTALTAAKERVVTLENMPAGAKPPVRFPHALERTFAANQDDPQIKRALDARADLSRLEQEAKAEPDEGKRQKIVERMIALQAEVAV